MTPETLLQKFEVMADAPNGVQKLRELVLELAVRGKLVPQDPSDEPGAALLERIAAEKERLFEEGKLAKPKPLLQISEGETRFELPEGWEWTRLDTLGTVNPRNDLPDAVTVAFCPMSSLPEDYGGATNHEERPWREIKKGYTHFAEDDVVVAKITPCFQNGKAAVMRNLRGGAGAGTTELHVFRPVNGTVVPDYVLIFLKSPGFVSGGVQTMTGTAGQQRVSRTYFAQSPFPLPPLAEQRRIVAKVDELIALCDVLEERQQRRTKARLRLNRSALHQLTTTSADAEFAAHWQRLRENFHLLYDTPETVAELRHAVLQIAVRGKLVPQDPSDEPASVLLERIAAEKKRLLSEGKIGTAHPLPLVGKAEVGGHCIPHTWMWTRLGSIVESMDSGWSPACPDKQASSPEEWGVLRTTSVQSLEYRDFEHKALSKTLMPRPQYEVHAGDLLITRAGPKNRVGISCVVIDTRPRLMISDKIIRCHPVEGLVYSRFVALCLNAGASAEYIESKKSGMAESQVNISQSNLTATPIPLLPLAEQRRIVAKVDELMALCDALEVQLTRASDKSAQLAASAVHRLTTV